MWKQIHWWKTFQHLLNAEGIRFLKDIFRNSVRKPKGRRWNFEDKMLALSLLKCSPKSFSFL